MVSMIVVFLGYQIGVNLLKSYVFRQPKWTQDQSFTNLTYFYLVLAAFRSFFNFTLAFLVYRTF